MDHRNSDLSLIFRVQTRLCALPLGHVLEILRPLPVEPLPGAPAFVPGLCVIRGEPLPVVDAAGMLGLQARAPEGTARFITVVAGPRRVALAVDAVLGVRAVPAGVQRALPPLLQQAGDAAAVAAIGLLDAELLLVLNSARLWPQHEAAV